MAPPTASRASANEDLAAYAYEAWLRDASRRALNPDCKPYHELPESDKEHYREESRKILAVFIGD
jgi:hypothetical protein